MICLDTAPLIWGVKRTATPGQEHMIARAAAFIESLKTTGEQVIIPAPVVTECLARVTSDQEIALAEVFERSFLVVPFDYAAAVIAGRLERRRLAAGPPPANSPPRTCVKTDVMIAAIAVVRRATRLITGDVNDFRIILAGETPRAEELPELPPPPDAPPTLFDDTDDE